MAPCPAGQTSRTPWIIECHSEQSTLATSVESARPTETRPCRQLLLCSLCVPRGIGRIFRGGGLKGDNCRWADEPAPPGRPFCRLLPCYFSQGFTGHLSLRRYWLKTSAPSDFVRRAKMAPPDQPSLFHLKFLVRFQFRQGHRGCVL